MISAIKSVLRNHRQRKRAILTEWRRQWAESLDAPIARKAANFDMMWYDHGLVRKYWKNRAEIAPGIWRSNQPTARDLRRYSKKMGIRTVLNLRGASPWGSYHLEEEACADLGLTLINMRLYSSRAPLREEIHTALDHIDRAEKPLLLHCKSGADRAGLGSVLYLLAQGISPEDAAQHLSWRYAHLNVSRTGILDAFVASYAAAHAKTGISFLDWVDQVYDPETLTQEFAESRAGNRVLDWILRRE